MGVPLLNPAALLGGQTLQPLKTGPSLQPLKSPSGADGETFHQVLDAESSKKPDKIAEVSKQFEALMIGQMLRSARESSGGGWLSSGDDKDDQSGSLVMDLAEQGFSQAMAARGGLGIAKMVTANLERGQPKTASSGSETSPAPANRDLKR